MKDVRSIGVVVPAVFTPESCPSCIVSLAFKALRSMTIIIVGVKKTSNVYARANMVSVCMCQAFYGL